MQNWRHRGKIEILAYLYKRSLFDTFMPEVTEAVLRKAWQWQWPNVK